MCYFSPMSETKKSQATKTILSHESGNALSMKYRNRGITKKQRVVVIDGDERGRRFIIQTRQANRAIGGRGKHPGTHHWSLKTVMKMEG